MEVKAKRDLISFGKAEKKNLSDSAAIINERLEGGAYFSNPVLAAISLSAFKNKLELDMPAGWSGPRVHLGCNIQSTSGPAVQNTWK